MKTTSKIGIIVLILILIAAGGGYFFVQHDGSHRSGDGHDHGNGTQVQYTCPMHPFILKDKPGACPICGMSLVKKVDGATATPKETADIAQVSLSPVQRVMANVATVEVKSAPMTREIAATGIVQYDQTRQAKVTAWVAGRIDRLYVNSVGSYVSKGKPVADVYSPDLVAAQQEYLLAIKSQERLMNSPIQAISQGGEGLVASARQRLKLMGIRDDQIAALEKGGQPNIRIPVYTPLSGVVIDKLVLEGQYVNAGDPLFNIADLSRVWVEVEVYEADFSLIRVGQPVSIISQSYPGKSFNGRVSFVYPFLDPKTRTVKVRVELPNPGLKLKPDMFVNAAVKLPLGDALSVPAAAVMETGKRQVVWVEVKAGLFEQRDVKAGARAGDSIQIISGLKLGEKVAASGGYLIDSEAQLNGGGNKAPAHEGHGTKATPPAGKDDLDMSDMKMK